MRRVSFVVLLVLIGLAATATTVSAAPGQLLWSKTWKAAGTYGARPAYVSVAGTGDIYIAATADDARTDLDFVVARYSPTGARKWVRFYDPAHSEHLNAIATDGTGNAILCGESEGAMGSTYRAVVVKFSRVGKRLWVRQPLGTALSEANDVITDGAGNIYVTGTATRTATQADWFTAKYSSAGKRLWLRYYSASASGDESARRVRIGPNGRLYVAGTSGEPDGTWQDLCLVRYSTKGVLEWSRTQGMAHMNDRAFDLAVGPAGACVVGELADGPRLLGSTWRVTLGGTNRPMTIDGVDGAADTEYQYRHAGIDKAGNLYAGGSIESLGTDLFYIIRHGADGSTKISFQSSSGNNVHVDGMAVTAGGTVYAAGTVPRDAGNVFVTAMLPSWIPAFSGLSGGATSGVTDLALTSRSFYVAGFDGSGLLLRKYAR